jgi:hypothetical protein
MANGYRIFILERRIHRDGGSRSSGLLDLYSPAYTLVGQVSVSKLCQVTEIDYSHQNTSKIVFLGEAASHYYCGQLCRRLTILTYAAEC